MPPASFNLKQKLAALSLGSSSPYSPSIANTRNGHGIDDESYPRSPTSPNARRKAFFNPPRWGKKPRGHNNSDIEIPVGEEEKRMVQEVLTRMIFQAGVDFECALLCSENYNPSEIVTPGHDQCIRVSLPIVSLYLQSHRVILNASALPDPQVVSYDLLLA
jgi:Rho GTPase-activating protein 1